MVGLHKSWILGSVAAVSMFSYVTTTNLLCSFSSLPTDVIIFWLVSKYFGSSDWAESVPPVLDRGSGYDLCRTPVWIGKHGNCCLIEGQRNKLQIECYWWSADRQQNVFSKKEKSSIVSFGKSPIFVMNVWFILVSSRVLLIFEFKTVKIDWQQ